MEAELTRLRTRELSYGHDAPGRIIRELRERHLKDPSEENFEALEKAQLDRDALTPNNTELRHAAKHATTDFIENKYLPFLLAILNCLSSADKSPLQRHRGAC